ncbi:MAG: hypothetical protein P4M12_04580 [Gammaproteobacteria bacterium]|nr:hypothetical protein [Gammaproteobacteria bacterium]
MSNSRNAENNRIDRFLETYNDRLGFRTCHSETISDETTNNKRWEFRFSIWPEHSNLKKATQVIADLFRNHPDFIFKTLSLKSGEQLVTLEEINWDGTKSTITTATDSDRDQRGKELTVYMTFNERTNNYIQNENQLKDIILRCWKALQDANIKGLGYCATPSGDLKLNSSVGLITPVTYTAHKPYEVRHGILNQHVSEADQESKNDPLKNCIITLNDLQKYEIKDDSTTILKNRIEYLTQHQLESKKFILAEVADVKAKAEMAQPDWKSYLPQLKDIISRTESLFPQDDEQPELNKQDATAFQNEINPIVDKLAFLLPRLANTELGFIDPLMQLKDLRVSKRIRKNFFDAIKAAIHSLEYYDPTYEINQTIEELNQYPDYFIDCNLAQMVNACPAEMQLVYRHIVLLEKEKTALVKDIQYQKEININALESFNKNIHSLEESGKVTVDVVNKYKTLSSTIINARVDATAAPYSTITEHFSNEITNLIKNPKPTPKQIEKSAKELDKKLYGKPPVKRTVKAAICGVIGALVGFVVGLTVGAAVTTWGGGFGALPGAILGAVKGFTLGTAIGLGTAALSAGIGGSLGFFSAVRNQNKFKEANTAKNETIHSDVLTSVNAIKNI